MLKGRITMTLSEYHVKAMRTNDGLCTERLVLKTGDHSKIEINGLDNIHVKPDGGIDIGGIINASLGLSGEVGELNEIIKKWIFHGSEADREHIKKELGDILWYVALMAHSFGFSLNETALVNIKKLLDRYPEGFDTERSNNRAEGDI